MRSVGRLPRKSYSYRYTIGSVDGAPGGPQPGCAIIETRYRGRTATWRVDSFRAGGPVWEVGGTFVEPRADNPLAYPPQALARPAPDTPHDALAAAAGADTFDAPALLEALAAPPQVATVGETFAPSTGAREPAQRPPAPRAERSRPTERLSKSDLALIAFQRALEVGEFDPVVS
jgi:hypothetical protein